MYIVGINAFHGDSSACLIKDGVMIAAAEEERFRRIKHWAGFPSEAIRYCLLEAGIKLADVDHIALNQDRRANFYRKIIFLFMARPEIGLVLERMRNRKKREGITEFLVKAFPDDEFNGKVHMVEHHLAHLASAFYVSPFSKALVVSVDGSGDFSTSAWGFGDGASLSVDGRIYFPHSLGLFYQALTQFIGFPYYGDEYKVMGLAPYGDDSLLDKMRQVVILLPDGTFRLNLDYFQHHKKGFNNQWAEGAPAVTPLFGKELEKLLGSARKEGEALEQRHRNIARATQMMYEEALFHLLSKLHPRYGTDALAIAGGCGMNSVANGKVLLKTPFKKLYVQSAAGDAGGAIGAAFYLWFQNGDKRQREYHNHAYWGPRFSNEQIESVLKSYQADFVQQRCLVGFVEDDEVLCARVSELIAQGKVIGWFQGSMEWGPRALGNRSILGDPRRADMKDLLNSKIKRRESFRPFAPSILRESVSEWFEQEDDVPFMMQVYQIRAEKRQLIPAVTHVDGSGRLQTVDKDSNPLYYKLIKTFGDLTGVPLLLNTSFNENEPVVCLPEEALNCFLRTKMDALVLGNWLIFRAE